MSLGVEPWSWWLALLVFVAIAMFVVGYFILGG
jgi:hypothetical protein